LGISSLVISFFVFNNVHAEISCEFKDDNNNPVNEIEYTNGSNPTPSEVQCDPSFNVGELPCSDEELNICIDRFFGSFPEGVSVEVENYDFGLWDCNVTGASFNCEIRAGNDCENISNDSILPFTIRLQFPDNYAEELEDVSGDLTVEGGMHCLEETTDEVVDDFNINFNALAFHASCGSAAKDYAFDETVFDGEFCSEGIANSSISFPPQGDTVDWQCVNGEVIANCTASRKSPQQPICGVAAKNYSVTESNFEGEFCAIGIVENIPKFPSSGAGVSWDCVNDLEVITCTATSTQNKVLSNVYGYIYFDDNHNDERDSEEKGAEDIKIKLKWAGYDNKFNTSDDKKYKDRTNKRGKYEFKDLVSGRYKVQIEDGEMVEFYLTAEKDKVNGRSIFELAEGETKKRDFGYDRDRDHKGNLKNHKLEYLKSGKSLSIIDILRKLFF